MTTLRSSKRRSAWWWRMQRRVSGCETQLELLELPHCLWCRPALARVGRSAELDESTKHRRYQAEVLDVGVYKAASAAVQARMLAKDVIYLSVFEGDFSPDAD